MAVSRLLILVAMFGMSACAHDPAPVPTFDLSTMACSPAPVVTSATELSWDGKNETPAAATIDGKAPCLEDGASQRSLYRVFKLPVAAAPYIISVAATPWSGTILAPRLLLLDADGVIRRSTSREDFTFRGTVLSALLRSHADETYLVVASDPAVTGQLISRISESVRANMIMAYPVVANFYTGSDSTTKLLFLPVGSLTVTFSAIPAKP